jgi:hypothetical protein
MRGETSRQLGLRAGGSQLRRLLSRRMPEDDDGRPVSIRSTILIEGGGIFAA